MKKQDTGDIDISVIVPTYNSVNTLGELIRRLTAVFRMMKVRYEIVFVNDCSPNPKTKKVLKNLSDEYPEVKAINLSRNFGQQAATVCGLTYSRGQYIVTMDDDLQHPPEAIPKLFEERDHDFVIANLIHRKDSLINRITSKVKSYFDYLILGKPKEIRLSPYRLIRREMVQHMLKIKTPNPFIPALMFYVSQDAVNVPVEHKERAEGESNYSFIKRFKLFTLIIINNSSFILKMVGYLGSVCFLISLLLIVYFIIFKWAAGDPPLGWTSTFTAILFFGGMTLFSIGIVGEYLIRIMPAIEEKPTFLIRDIYE